MGAGIINLIGGYILILFLIGLARTKLPAREYDAPFRAAGRLGRLLILSLLLIVSLKEIFNWYPSHGFWSLFYWPYLFISGFSIWVHEGGHFLLGLFGWDFLAVSGGTLTQVFLPLIFAARLQIKGAPYAAALLVWWSGFALISCSRYIADARALKLELLGGDGIHDWNWLLWHFGLLEYDQLLGKIVFVLALGVMLVGVGRMVLLEATDFGGSDAL